MRNKKKILNLFLEFSESNLNFEHFQKKDDTHNWCVSDITDS